MNALAEPDADSPVAVVDTRVLALVTDPVQIVFQANSKFKTVLISQFSSSHYSDACLVVVDARALRGEAPSVRCDIFSCIEEFADSGTPVILFARQFGDGQFDFSTLKRRGCQGNMTIWTNDDVAAKLFERWSLSESRHRAPRCLDDLSDPTLVDVIRKIAS